MMITKEQYEAAKKIVDEYERMEYEDNSREAEDDDFYLGDDDDENDPLEDEFNNCTCGAFVIGKNGICKISDCIC